MLPNYAGYSQDETCQYGYAADDRIVDFIPEENMIRTEGDQAFRILNDAGNDKVDGHHKYAGEDSTETGFDQNLQLCISDDKKNRPRQQQTEGRDL